MASHDMIMSRIRHFINFCVNNWLVDVFSLELFDLFIKRCPVQQLMNSISTDAVVVTFKMNLFIGCWGKKSSNDADTVGTGSSLPQLNCGSIYTGMLGMPKLQALGSSWWHIRLNEVKTIQGLYKSRLLYHILVSTTLSNFWKAPYAGGLWWCNITICIYCNSERAWASPSSSSYYPLYWLRVLKAHQTKKKRSTSSGHRSVGAFAHCALPMPEATPTYIIQ